MNQSKGKLTIYKTSEAKATKPVFIDTELLNRINEIKQETGVPINRLVDKMLRYALNNIEITEEHE